MPHHVLHARQRVLDGVQLEVHEDHDDGHDDGGDAKDGAGDEEQDACETAEPEGGF